MNQLFSFVRIFLYPFALIYGAVVWLRNRLYDSGFFSSVSFSVPVISVGNLSVGGTGKTPHVEYLISLLQYEYKIATMSRGYKRRTQGFVLADATANALRIGDEPMQYHMKYPEVAVSVAEERITGIPRLLQLRPETDVVLLDDAYQHRSVKPGINILITDYSRPFYKDHILPYGRLRERRAAYKRADIIVVSKSPAGLTDAEAAAVRDKIAPHAHQQVFFSAIRYDQPYDLFSRNPVSLQGKNAVLVCGIARPEPMIAHVTGLVKDVHVLPYADHHYFISKDLEEIKAAFDNWDVPDKVIVTTEKDATRLYLHADQLRQWEVQILVLPIKVSILLGEAGAFDRLITQYVAGAVAEHREYYTLPEPPVQQEFPE